MKDLVIAAALFGLLVGVGCGVARAQQAESPNYRLEYTDENTPSTPAVEAEQDVQFDTQSSPAATAAKLPATTPPYMLIGAVVAGLAIAIIIYFALK